MLILAVAIGLYLLAAPDPITLRSTRGAAGAIGSMARPTRPRSTPTRSTPRPTRSTRPPTRSKAGSTRPDPTPDPTRPGSRSRLAAGIRGWIRSADAATTRRQELHDAVHEALERGRARRAKRREAEAEVADENARALQDRVQQRAQSSTAVKQAAAHIQPPPAPPAQPNGAAVALDVAPIPTTELETLDHLLMELEAAATAAEQLCEAARPVIDWCFALNERYTGSADLPKTPDMNTAEMNFADTDFGGVIYNLRQVVNKLSYLKTAIGQEQARLKEIGQATGRLENVSS